ncbi:MAG: hypothetical protein QMD23_03690 [Candidatus Bathyarchaeia archaeon]|nr:hypothetical protein [Candidatus Bathyarchaeia archaeon]
MPYWTVEHEKALSDMIKENKAIEEIAKHFRRSEDAIKMKLKRMGLPIPEKCRAKSAENKVTINATTTPKPKPIKMAKDLISPRGSIENVVGLCKTPKRAWLHPARR